MQKLYFAIQLLQVMCLGYGALTHSRYNQLYPEEIVAHLNAAGNGESMRMKRETSKSWTVGTFSECSVNCGGGLRVRSVRCLNEDGIVFDDDCDLSERPDSYEFCNQIDCTTGISDTSLFPASNTYNFTSGDSSFVLQFDYQLAGIYVVQLNTTESDGSSTKLLEGNSPLGAASLLSTTPASNTMSIVNSGSDSFFEVDDENILTLNNVERTSIASDKSISFQDNMIVLEDLILIVDTLQFFDGSRFYTFNDTDLTNALNGPGILYYNPDTLQAFFSTGSSLNEVLDDSIPSTMTEVTTSPATSSSTPDQTTSTAATTQSTAPTASISTSSPISSTFPTTDLPPSSTEGPTDACDDPPSRPRKGPHSRRSPHSRRNSHSRRSSNDSSSSSSRYVPCDENSNGSKSNKSRPSRRFKSHSHGQHDHQVGGRGGRHGGPGGPDASPGGRADGPSRRGGGPSL